MFYSVIKFISRISFFLFYREINVCGKAFINQGGPTLLLANHPNSFLDAIIIGNAYSRPFHFLVRSDMFKNFFLKWILKGLNGIPVYRHTEEKNRLRENQTSFNQCIDILKNNGTILIFAEGITIHDWEIKPIKSGPARLIWDALKDVELKERLTIIPIGINYNQYNHAGKHVYLFAGEPINNISPKPIEKYGEWKNRLKLCVREELRKISFVFSYPDKNSLTIWKSLLTNIKQFQPDHCKTLETINHLKTQISVAGLFNKNLSGKWIQQYFPFSKQQLLKDNLFFVLLLIPAVIGFTINYPFYKLLHFFVKKIFAKGIFFDSVLFATLTFLSPFYFWLIAVYGNMLTGYNSWLIFAISIITGIICKYWMMYCSSIYNYYNLTSAERNQLQMLLTNNQHTNEGLPVQLPQ